MPPGLDRHLTLKKSLSKIDKISFGPLCLIPPRVLLYSTSRHQLCKCSLTRAVKRDGISQTSIPQKSCGTVSCRRASWEIVLYDGGLQSIVLHNVKHRFNRSQCPPSPRLLSNSILNVLDFGLVASSVVLVTRAGDNRCHLAETQAAYWFEETHDVVALILGCQSAKVAGDAFPIFYICRLVRLRDRNVLSQI